MELNASYPEAATAFDLIRSLIIRRGPPNLLWCMTNLQFCLSGWIGLKYVPRLDQDAVQSLATFLLTSIDPVSFVLGLGVQIILSGQRKSSPVYLNAQRIAQALHGIVTRNVLSDEQTMLSVAACTAKEALYLDLPEIEETTTLRRFFTEIIALHTFMLPPSNDLHEYTRLRFQMVDHSLSMRLVFPASINVWLALQDIETLAVRVSTTEVLSQYNTALILQDELSSTSSCLRILIRDLWFESPEALECIAEGFNLYGQMVMVSQGLELAVNYGRRSALYDSLSILRQSLARQIEGMGAFAMSADNKERPNYVDLGWKYESIR